MIIFLEPPWGLKKSRNPLAKSNTGQPNDLNSKPEYAHFKCSNVWSHCSNKNSHTVWSLACGSTYHLVESETMCVRELCAVY